MPDGSAISYMFNTDLRSGTWSGWLSLDGFATALATVQRRYESGGFTEDRGVAVFHIDGGGKTWYRFSEDLEEGRWTDWQDLEGFAKALAVAPGPTPTVFHIGSDDAIYCR